MRSQRSGRFDESGPPAPGISSNSAVLKPSILLATLGVLLTAGITGLAASWILNISLLEGLLLGSIVGSTDASAVFSILRWGGVSLPKRIAAVLKVRRPKQAIRRIPSNVVLFSVGV